MSDDRFAPENNPPISKPVPCRRYVEQPRDEVSADEIFEWLDKYERATGTGKHRPKPKPQAPPASPHTRGEGRFGTEGESE